MSMNEILTGIRALRDNIRRSTGRPEGTVRDRLGLLKENFTTKLQSGIQAQRIQAQQCNQASGAQGCPTAPTAPNTGAQAQYLNPSRKAGLFGLGLFAPPQQQQAPAPPPPPPTEKEKREMAQQQRLREIKERKYRRDTLQGLSVGN